MRNFPGSDRTLKMETVKAWFLTKLNSLSIDSAQARASSGHPRPVGALTPKNIPDFIIPGSGDSSRRQSSELESIEEEYPVYNSFSPRSSIGSTARSSPGMSLFGSNGNLDVPKASASRSLPVSPKHEVTKTLVCHNSTPSLRGPAGSNADPHSYAAMSLPHFRVQTSFGFTTLSQSPHTRRKESLFHCGNDSLFSYRRTNSLDALKTGIHTDVDGEIFGMKDPYDTFRGIRKGPAVVVTPSGNSPNNPNGHVNSHQAMTTLGNKYYITTNDSGMCQLKPRTRYYRRRSSLVELNSSEESSSQTSGDASPEIKRKSMSSLYPNVRVDSNVQPKRHSSPQLHHIKRSASNSEVKPPVSIKIQNQPCPFLVQYGELKFSFQYLARSRQLKVILIKAENLGGEGKVDNNVNAFAKLYLLPGKLQKQTSDIVKHTRKPVFDQEFYFHGLSIEQLHAMTLRIKVFHKSHNLRLPDFIGKVDVNLDSFDLLTENRMWKDLDIKREREDLGSIEIALSYQPEDCCVHVTALQAKGLPVHPITGNPDPYVRVEVSQPRKSVARKLTKTKKSTSEPIFNETFTFSISMKKEDLKETKIVVTVFDRERIRSDEVLGHVKISKDSWQTTAMDQWMEAFNNPRDNIRRWHELVDQDEDV